MATQVLRFDPLGLTCDIHEKKYFISEIHNIAKKFFLSGDTELCETNLCRFKTELL